MVLVKLNSDNFQGERMSIEVYENVALNMSTGDHATHTTELMVCGGEFAPSHIIGFDDDTGEAIYTCKTD